MNDRNIDSLSNSGSNGSCQKLLKASRVKNTVEPASCGTMSSNVSNMNFPSQLPHLGISDQRRSWLSRFSWVLAPSAHTTRWALALYLLLPSSTYIATGSPPSSVGDRVCDAGYSQCRALHLVSTLSWPALTSSVQCRQIHHHSH